jgi:hypothetical protein
MYICAGIKPISIATIRYAPYFLVAGKINNTAATISRTPAAIFMNTGFGM